jgi:spore germination protein GerM
MRLIGVSRNLAELADTTAQARAIIEAQLAPPPPPLLSPIPPGTQLHAVYLTARGDAFVDLSEDITLGHSGGSLEELFTVYAIVNALTSNLPAINAVQILVNGQEVDTLVGHVDMRRPLQGDLSWVVEPAAQSNVRGSKLSSNS